MTKAVRHPHAPLTGAERKARIDVIREAAAYTLETGDKPGYKSLGRKIGVHPATLATWAAKNMPAEVKIIARGPGRQANSSELLFTRPPKLREMLSRTPPLTLAESARELGISASALRAWLKTNNTPILDEYVAMAPKGVARSLPEEQALARAKTVREMRNMGFRDHQIAKRLGISGAALSFWLKRNAPHGVDELIDMLDDSEDLA